jgi:acetyltransferase-like isoleucine patch superfamily enzyme
MFAWGSVVTDSWINEIDFSPDQRRKILRLAAKDGLRFLPIGTKPKSILVEDNVWVGFDAVILPGVTLGRGSIIGSKTIIAEDVPAYCVVAGSPAKIIRHLKPDDSDEIKKRALRDCLLYQ